MLNVNEIKKLLVYSKNKQTNKKIFFLLPKHAARCLDLYYKRIWKKNEADP